ncbi:3-hydroxyacyl-CoA dehydrogenase NAD-binding domain-containing protein [Vreelandella titanicae]|uniref:3-hydroxyacyl-CoA dehydrogenase NAD-binding domain-containing protein n=1 Tax=Vreelandella titanicae TaxID=664683 RepID=UPI001CC2271D|nr:3-hydroxyacyl-CoA dehydrogenase NAD-binding domain-containing protein [Halomonas titanicae]
MPHTSLQTAPMLDKVSFSVEGDVAIIRINNPPVNAGSHAVRSGLIKALAQTANHTLAGVVIIGEGRSFIAGSDLKEFGKPLGPPELPDVITAIETLELPVVAALHGVALGGGLELALGCDYRIASVGTKLGLPEVSLGMVPGAGGTQRLPRLIGRSRAMEMICGAQRIEADEALALGLIDALAEEDLLATAKQWLKAELRTKRLAKAIRVPEESAERLSTSAERALKRGKHRPNIAEAIRLVESTADGGVDKTLAEERRVFQQLRLSDDAFALRYLFFAERRAAAVDGLDSTLARNVSGVGVVGGGTMGQGIALAFLAKQHHVVIAERDAEVLGAALNRLRDTLQRQVDKGRLNNAQRDEQLARLSGVTELDAMADCDLVIEAVFEDLDAKRMVLNALETVLPAETLIATNTSYLDIDAMAQTLDHPQRLLGLHFFSPANVMPLLEIVRANATADWALASALKLARRLGKQPVVSRVAEGFIGNRIYAAYRRRAELLVLDGARPEDVDTAVEAFGFAMGPFAVSDMSGLDIAWAMRKRQAADRDPSARYVTIADRLCEAGRLGRKTGKGWYDYSDGRGKPDPMVTNIIDEARREAGVTPTTFDSEMIQRQLLAAMVNEAACLLEEDVAQRPSDIDVTLANGYGFPRWRGGPLYWASRQPSDALAIDFDKLAAGIGHEYRAGPVRAVLESLKAETEEST